MELAIVLLILVALGFLYYGWIRLRQEAEVEGSGFFGPFVLRGLF